MNRDDLKNYKYTQEWIKERLEYIEELKTQIKKITTVISDMPKGSNAIQDGMAEKIVILQDSLDELLGKIVESDKKQKEIIKQIDKIEQPYRLILDKVYIQGKTLVTVASEMNYSYRDLCRKHGVALNKFNKF